ncbi:MAG TPA: porin [Steroidobacteraceae bacterium]|nr:porin [Steroidobacteraceae bacterium]
MILRKRLVALAALSLPIGPVVAQNAPAPTPASVPGTPTDTAALLRKIEDQERRIEALEHKLQHQEELEAEASQKSAAERAATPTPASTSTAGATAAVAGQAAISATNTTQAAAGTVIAGPSGLFIQSNDGANVIRFRGNLAVDGRWYSDHVTPETADTWLFRRVRPYFEGTLDRIYDFRFMPDFGNGKSIIVDAFVTGRFQPWFVVQAGKFKGPVGLERLQPDQFNRFMELGLPSSLVPNRDLGVQIGGDIGGGILGYAVGYFDGTTDGNSTDANTSPDVDNDGKKDIEGRLFSQPFVKSDNPWLRGFGLGVGGTYVNSTGSATNTLLASYKTPGQQTFFTYRTGATATYADGKRERWTPQFYYYAGPFGAIGEYVDSRQDVSRHVTQTLKRSATLDNTAWQISLSYFLTGEKAAYNSYTPLSTFEPGKSGWGAWEIAARFHQLQIDDAAFAGGGSSFADPTVSPRRAIAYGVGLNWYLNQNVKWMLDYERTRFDGGSKTGGDRPDENALLTRFSLVY